MNSFFKMQNARRAAALARFRHLRSLPKEEQQRLGALVQFEGNAWQPYVHNLGTVERREQEGGKVITTVYPKMMFKKRRPYLTNLHIKQGK